MKARYIFECRVEACIQLEGNEIIFKYQNIKITNKRRGRSIPAHRCSTAKNMNTSTSHTGRYQSTNRCGDSVGPESSRGIE